MKVGTKSVIFGVHSILVHPFFVACAYWRLFGLPWDPRLWLAFFVHDLGYVGKANMEGPEGQQHVVLGGRIMGWLCGPSWRDFVLCHSRHWAESVGKGYSKLCLADKLAFVLTPAWLYIPMARLSGELREYMRVSSERQLGGRVSNFELSLLKSRNPRVWLEGLKLYTRRWIERHRDGGRDRRTKAYPQHLQRELLETRSGARISLPSKVLRCHRREAEKVERSQ